LKAFLPLQASLNLRDDVWHVQDRRREREKEKGKKRGKKEENKCVIIVKIACVEMGHTNFHF
jgi:hypothetical protein